MQYIFARRIPLVQHGETSYRAKSKCSAPSACTPRNKFIQLENTLVMYGVYNAETLEKLIKTVHTLHNRQSMYEKLFAVQITKA